MAATSFKPLGKVVGTAQAPFVSASDFGLDGSEGSGAAADQIHFETLLSLFRQGKGAPPAPPSGNGNFHQFTNPNAPANLYRRWWVSTGRALADKWYAEHHTGVTVRKPVTKAAATRPVTPPVAEVTAETSKHRARLEVADTSGW